MELGRFNGKPSRCHSLSAEHHEKLANHIGQPAKLVRAIGLVILKAECMIKTMVKNVGGKNEIPAIKNPIRICPKMGQTSKQLVKVGKVTST